MLDVANKDEGGGWKQRTKQRNSTACPKSSSHSPCYHYPPRAYACSDGHAWTDPETSHPILQLCQDGTGIWVTPNDS